MAKTEQITYQIRNRIERGDYVLRDIPSERQLAREFGVSYMTARRAVQPLIAEGMVCRLPSGGFWLPDAQSSAREQRHFAILTPVMMSPDIEQLRMTLQGCMKGEDKVTPHFYSHWEDPVVLEAINRFDGVFLVPYPDAPPAALLENLLNHRVIMIEQDFSPQGIPSLILFPPSYVQNLMDHLADIGHKQIACITTQSPDPVIEARVRQYQLWMHAHACSGPLIHEIFDPVPYSSPYEASYEAMKRKLALEDRDFSAVIGVTAPAAIGAMRALSEAGILPGKDVAVCAVNGEGWSQYLCPSLTALEVPEIQPCIQICLEWMRDSTAGWIGPLLLQPSAPNIMIRETSVAPLGVSEYTA